MTEVVSFNGYAPPARYDDEPFTTVEVEEAATAAGPWTLIDTLTLDPVDASPASPATRNLTTTLGSAPGLWYRLSFVDDNGGHSAPTDPVHNAAGETQFAAQFATADEFAARIGQTLSDDEVSRVDGLLTLASALIQGEARQQIGLVSDDVLTIPGTSDDTIKLPERPVVAVSSVTLDGRALSEGSEWYLDGNTLVRRLASVIALGAGLSLGRGFGRPSQTLEITYTHGYADPPGLVKAICLEAVVRVFVNPGAIAQEHVGDTSTLYAYASSASDSAGLLLTRGEQRAILRRFGRPAQSVTVGR